MNLIRLLKKVFSKREYFYSGIILFFILFCLSTFMNMGISYMGNKSDKIASILLQNFLSIIIIQILKVLLTYLVIGAVSGLIFYRAAREILIRLKSVKSNNTLLISLITFTVLFICVFLLFSGKLIYNPQLFTENFSQHLSIFKDYQFFLTDNVNPAVFYSLLLVIFFIAFVFFVLSFNWKNIFNSCKKIASMRYSRIAGLLFLGMIIVYSLYNNNLIFSNKSDKPNIIIISSDALRPDHMSLNGYNKNTTPNIDSLAKESLQIKGTITALPRTFPSWVSTLTSTYSLTHGINHMFPRTRERNNKFITAADYLNNKGYTSAVISDFAGDIFPRIDLGFKKTLAPDMTLVSLVKQTIIEKQTFLLPFIANKYGLIFFPELMDTAKLSFTDFITDQTCREINSSRGKPFFILTFYSITHFPFSPPYPYYKKFSDPVYRGPYKYFKDRVIKLNNNDTSTEVVTESDNRQVNSLYDGCMNLFDREAGKIISFLKNRKLLDNTIVIITSDHGENLYEKNMGMGHGEHLRGNYSLEVPLIIYYSGLKNKGETIRLSSSTIDIIPTIFDIAGFKVPDNFDGSSLLKKISGKKDPENIDSVDSYCETGMWFDNDKSSPLFFAHQRIDYPDISGVSEVDFGYRSEIVISGRYQNIVNGAKYRTIYSGKYKLIYVPLSSGVKFELYDHLNDPDNRYDISGERPDILAKMKNSFYKFVNDKSSGNFIIKDGVLFPAFRDPLF